MSYVQPGPYEQPGSHVPQPSGPPQRPGIVTAAAVITILIGVLITLTASLLLAAGAIFMFAAGDLPAESRDLPGMERMIAVGIGVMVAIVLILLCIGMVLIVSATKAMRGRNWARITITVFLVLGALGGLTDASSGNMAGVILMVLAVVFFWLPPAGQWFAARTAYDRAASTPPSYPGTHHPG